jgi:alpha-methylacyl-CoA racemase
MGKGPLSGIKILEMAGIGPAPFCAMLLSDLGAEVLRIDRVEPSGLGIAREARFDLLNRGRRSVALDLKKPEAIAALLQLIERADALIEGFRPGVMERLGLGPEECCKRSRKLVYGRMTGWGQEGPLSQTAGHDINYIALTGALHAIGRKGEAPVAPLNLIGDFGGGALYLAFGVAAALVEAQRSGQGQVVDAAMVDGSASLLTMFHGFLAQGLWRDERGVNILDGAAPWYDAYETADGKYLAIGAIEAKFYAELIELLGLDNANLPAQHDRKRWPELRLAIAGAVRGKTRDAWVEIFGDSDACVAPVLSMLEAKRHPHLAARGTFTNVDGVDQPAPAPRFSRTPGAIQGPPPERGQHTQTALADWGLSPAELEALKLAGALG